MRYRPLLVLFFVLIVSCEKDGGYELDKGVYFNVTTGGETFSNYGFSHARDDEDGGPEINVAFIPDASGTPQTQVLLVAIPEIKDMTDKVLFTTGNCYTDIYMSKPGNDVIGQYSQVIGNLTSNSIRVNAKRYYFSRTGLSFNITKMDSYKGRTTYEGNFSALLHPETDTTQSQPATGNFKVYVR